MKKLIAVFFLFFAQKLKSQTTVDSTLNSFVKEWLGVPYKWGGKTKKGIDCSKFTQRLYEDVYNLIIPGVSWKQWDFTERISLDGLKTGDLVFFNSKLSPSGWHVGTYLTDGFFVHASNRKDDVKVSSLNDEPYKKNFKGGGRVKKLDQ